MKSFLEENNLIGPIEMNLRDYFAAKAMQGFCANISRDLTLNIEHFTKVAYKVADAMMEARNESI